MKVILAGGSGLIGRALTDELTDAGYSVVILSRRPESIRALPEGAVVARWDGRSAGALVPRLEGAAAIVNLAGESIGDGMWSEARKLRIRHSRIRSTGAISEALRRVDQRPEVILQASAVGIYGTTGDAQATEDHPAGADFLASVSRDWESASAEVESFGVRRVLLRTGVVLDAGAGALPKIAMPFRYFVGGRAGSGRQWFPWIHIRDEVRAIRFLLESGEESGAFNLTAPSPVTNRELAGRLGKVLGRPSVVPTPAFVLRAVMGEMATLVLDGQRAVPARLLAAGFDFDFPELEPALEDLLG